MGGVNGEKILNYYYLALGALTLFSACSSTQSDIRGEGNQRTLAIAASKL